MGTYATFDDTIHPTQASDLAEYCTACGNTGWVEYPVTLLEPELDPCPHGCMDAELLLECGQQFAIDTGFDAQWNALVPEEYPALDPEMDALHEKAKWETEAAPDPFLTLSQQFRLRGVKRYVVEAAHHQGGITSDHNLVGEVLVDGVRRTAVVPKYLVGQVLHMDRWETTIRYEYLGSHVDVIIMTDLVHTLTRFAHSWDDSFSTAELIG